MILAIADVLSAADLDEVRAGLATATFVDGKATAGWSARLVKANLQAEPRPGAGAYTRRWSRRGCASMPCSRWQCGPRPILGPLFSRYEPGHAYGAHVDDALMGGVRTDVSFTLFLSDAGQLRRRRAGDRQRARARRPSSCRRGSVVTYPATTLHRVAPVTRGQRLAAVGWVRSFVRDAARRELLFDLETARRRLFDREGKRRADLLAKCAANLLRMWCED